MFRSIILRKVYSSPLSPEEAFNDSFNCLLDEHTQIEIFCDEFPNSTFFDQFAARTIEESGSSEESKFQLLKDILILESKSIGPSSNRSLDIVLNTRDDIVIDASSSSMFSNYLRSQQQSQQQTQNNNSNNPFLAFIPFLPMFFLLPLMFSQFSASLPSNLSPRTVFFNTTTTSQGTLVESSENSQEVIQQLQQFMNQFFQQTERQPLTNKQIVELFGPYQKVKSMDIPLLEEKCPCCFEGFVVNEGIRRLPCSHTFHKRCVDKWFRLGQVTCPMCRRNCTH
jgi:hypothetical protein